MPTYDYRCPEGHEFEHFFRKISDATAEYPCPVCGAVAARKVSGGAGLVFKGSGFYLTDYGRNAHRKSAPSPSAATTDSGSSSKGEGTAGGTPAKSDAGNSSSSAPAPKSSSSAGGE